MTNTFSYNFKLKLIRPYVNFNFDLRKKLSPSEKKLITFYYNALAPSLIKVSYDEKTHKPKIKYNKVDTYRPRKKSNLKIAASLLNKKDLPLSKLKAIPITTQKNKSGGKIKRKLRIRKGRKPAIIRNGQPLVYIEWDAKKLLGDYEKYIRNKMRPYKNYDYFYLAVYTNAIKIAVTNIDDLIKLYEQQVFIYKEGEINGAYASRALIE